MLEVDPTEIPTNPEVIFHLGVDIVQSLEVLICCMVACMD